MEARVFLFLHAAQMHQLKAEDTEINPYRLCLENISKDFEVNKIKKTNCDFSVNYNTIDISDIIGIYDMFDKKA